MNRISSGYDIDLGDFDVYPDTNKREKYRVYLNTKFYKISSDANDILGPLIEMNFFEEYGITDRNILKLFNRE